MRNFAIIVFGKVHDEDVERPPQRCLKSLAVCLAIGVVWLPGAVSRTGPSKTAHSGFEQLDMSCPGSPVPLHEYIPSWLLHHRHRP